MSDQLSAQDKDTIQMAAHGVATLMTSCAPGVVGVLTSTRASTAAYKALSTATGLTGQILADKPRTRPFKGNVTKTADRVLPALTESVKILDRAKQGEGDNFRRTLLAVAESAANANGGATPAESEMLRKIRDALRQTAS